MKQIFCVLVAVLLIINFVNGCEHAGGPVKQSTIINYLKGLIEPSIPLSVPSVEVSVAKIISFNASNVVLKTFDFTSANMQVVKANTVYFTLNGLVGILAFDWTLATPNQTAYGTASLQILNSKGSITAFIQQDEFKNVNATFVVGQLILETSNLPVIEPYWELLQPIVIDTLQREIPNLILELDTKEIKSLVYPIVLSVEPVHIPDLNATVLGVYGGFSNMTLNNIDFTAATMGRGSMDNEVVFELTGLTALITNDWEFKALDIDQKGSGDIYISQTDVSVSVGIGEDSQSEFTVNLDASKITIGDLEIKIDGGSGIIINWLIEQLKPLLINTIEQSFEVVLCILFNGIPN